MKKPWDTWVLRGLTINEAAPLFEKMERMQMTPWGHAFGWKHLTLPDGRKVKLTIQKNGPVPIYTALAEGGRRAIYLMEDGWLAWEVVPTEPAPVYPVYPLELFSPYYRSVKPSDVWVDNTLPAVPDIEPRQYTGLTRLLAQGMVGAKRPWSDLVPPSFSTGGAALGIQRGPDMEYWLFNVSAAQGLLAVKLQIPVTANAYHAVVLDPNAIREERNEAEAKLFGLIELPTDPTILTLITPEAYAASIVGGPINGSWHWMYQQAYRQSRAGAIVINQTQSYAFGSTGGFKSQEHRITIGWDQQYQPVASLESEDEQKWLHHRNNLHLWIGFGDTWNDLLGTTGGNPSVETEYLESNANIYARYDTNDTVIYTGINGLRELAPGTVLPAGANEANAFMQYIKFCGGTGGGIINQVVNEPQYTLHSWFDGDNEHAEDTFQGSATYTWTANGGSRTEVRFDPSGYVSMGDAVDLVNCTGGTTHYGCDDADPYTGIQQIGEWIADAGSWSKTVVKDFQQGVISHLFLGDDPEVLCIAEQAYTLSENTLAFGTIEWLSNVGTIIGLQCGPGGAYSGEATNFACQIFGYDAPDVYACARVSAPVSSTSGDSLHAEYSVPVLKYRWPGDEYVANVVPNWLEEFVDPGTFAISAAPYMNASYGGLAVTTDYTPPGLLPEAVDNFGCWEGGT